MKNKVQVNKEHYYEKYDSLERFISYFYQINLIKKLEPKKILEIGVGNRTVSNYLKQNGFDISTCDFDRNLKPNFVADIRKLPFKNNSYDFIIACEILEHIPWRDVEGALSELFRVSRKHILISIPYSSVSFEFIFRFPLLGRILKKPFINLFFRIPFFFRNINFTGEHYWEMGRKDYSITKVRKKFKKYFDVIKEIRPILNPYHHFFVLEKKSFSHNNKRSKKNNRYSLFCT